MKLMNSTLFMGFQFLYFLFPMKKQTNKFYFFFFFFLPKTKERGYKHSNEYKSTNTRGPKPSIYSVTSICDGDGVVPSNGVQVKNGKLGFVLCSTH